MLGLNTPHREMPNIPNSALLAQRNAKLPESASESSGGDVLACTSIRTDAIRLLEVMECTKGCISSCTYKIDEENAS